MLPVNRVAYILNHPQPYAGIGVAEFTAATQTLWSEIPHGGDVPAAASLRGESLLDTRRNNAVARAVDALAEKIGNEARELAALSGRAT